MRKLMTEQTYIWPYENEVGEEEIVKSDVLVLGGGSVSYTHLDVYKRQYFCRPGGRFTCHFPKTGSLKPLCCGIFDLILPHGKVKINKK